MKNVKLVQITVLKVFQIEENSKANQMIIGAYSDPNSTKTEANNLIQALINFNPQDNPLKYSSNNIKINSIPHPITHKNSFEH